MGYSNSNLIVKIIHLLETKRDGLILIDGKWGTGKTYFVKNTLPFYYDLNPFFYISLLGVKSLADFKAKIIDCYYLQDLNTLKSGLDTISGIGSISSGSPASANVLNSVFNSIGSSVKENILSKLSGIFILDDIERVNDPLLENEILTYCHSLYSTAINHLDFIVISNTSTESPLNLKHKEKIISDSVHYNPNPHEILHMGIIEDKLKHIPSDDRTILEEIIIYNNIVNVRILTRSLNIALPLYLYAKEHPKLSWKTPSATILSSILSFFILLFLYNKSMDELTKENEYFLLNAGEDPDPHEARLWSMLSNYKINKDLKNYCSGNVSFNDIIDEVFYEPDTLSIIDIAISTRPELYNVDEKKLHTTIINLITRKIPCDLHSWLKSIQNYEYLTFHKYLPKSSGLTLQIMSSKLLEFSDDEIITCFEQYLEYPSSIISSGFEDGKLLYKIAKCRYERIMKEKNLRSIKVKIETEGWAVFDVELLSKLDSLGNYKPLTILGAPFFTKCILKRWSIKDIEQFNSFLRSNYRISNISQFAKTEKSHLIYLNQKLDIFCLSYKEGFKYGAIHALNNTIKHAISCL
ncbi:hypothetical protein R1Z32_001698 [Citrobacter freundii]|nr:hypothetical protein [Citrobacter freundii]